jgi:hypothetical protein
VIERIAQLLDLFQLVTETAAATAPTPMALPTLNVARAV